MFTALVAAIVALIQGLWSLWQRRQELRWKKAELARELVDRWFAWPGSSNALTMIDEGVRTYELEGYESHLVDPEIAIPRALEITSAGEHRDSTSNTDIDRLVRKSFDVLFYNFERVEHSIQIGVVRREDVRVPAAYYIGRLARFRGPVEQYLDFAGFARAKQFLHSFAEWGGRSPEH